MVFKTLPRNREGQTKYGQCEGMIVQRLSEFWACLCVACKLEVIDEMLHFS